MYYGKCFFTLMVVCCLLCAEQIRLAKGKVQPKIITTDGALHIQSATNKNVTFAMDGTSDVVFGETSINELVNTMKQQHQEIEKLKQGIGVTGICSTSKALLCHNDGICVDVQNSENGYKCLCQPGFTGKMCETKTSTPTDLCANMVCYESSCIMKNGWPHCLCPSDRFGRHCQYMKPKNCNYELIERAGAINSPGYPDSYPSDMECTWLIHVRTGYIIQVIVAVASIGNGTDCDSTDYVMVSDSVKSSRICGHTSPPTFYSISNSASITMVTKGEHDHGHGFSIFYSEVENEACGGLLTAPFGSLTTSTTNGGPLHCQWVIKTSDAVHIDIKNLKIINKPSECKDYFEIAIGYSENDSRTYQRLCYTKANTVPTFTSFEYPYIFVTFVSSGESEISAKYTTVCGGEIKLSERSTQIIKSPMYPMPYPYKQKCVWTIKSPADTTIAMKFTDFDVNNAQRSCSSDYVQIQYGSQSYTFCSSNDPHPLQSSTNQMVVTFMTDGYQDFQGFKAELNVVKAGCGGVYTGVSGSISSPLLTGITTTSGPRDCIYIISSLHPSEVIQLYFERFKLSESQNCALEYIEIYDGDSMNSNLLHNTSESLTGRFCGERASLPVTTSSSRSLTVLYHYTEQHEYSEFNAFWSTIAVQEGCSYYNTAPSGTIQTTNYPTNQYSRNQDCKYTIEALDGRIIRLKFKEFTLEDSPLCQHDYISIYDGDNNKATLIGKYCGDELPSAIVSSGNFLYLEFHSNGAIESKGFMAEYDTGTDLCGGTLRSEHGFIQSPGYPNPYPRNEQCEWIIITEPGNTINLYIEDFQLESSSNCSQSDSLTVTDNNNEVIEVLCGEISSDIAIKSKDRYLKLFFRSDMNDEGKGFRLRYESGCGGELDSRTGVISSPNYPEVYPSNRQCNWTINGHTNDKIRISVDYFNLQEGCSDYLSIVDPVDSASYLFCGQNATNITLNHKAVLSFNTDSSSSKNAEGFKLTYMISGCSQDLTGESGTIGTPNNPDYYPANSYCLWRIRVREGMKIRLQFSPMELEKQTGCSHDNVTVYNGYSVEHPLIGQYCSSEQGPIILSTSNEMTVLFRSDGSVNGKGFTASYSTEKDGCGGVLVAPSGNIFSPGYPNNYPASVYCKWLVTIPASDGHVVLTFDMIDIESTEDCYYDSLQVVDMANNQLLGKFCGLQRNITLTATGQAVQIEFRSSAETTGKGFSASYRLGCGGRRFVNTTDAGYITSPHYPNHYERSDCEWWLVTDPGLQITLSFETLNLESCVNCSCDRVEVYNGDILSGETTLIGVYCGHELPYALTSNGNAMVVRFKADETHHYSGFKAKYTAFSGACGGHLTGYEGSIVSPLYPNSSPGPARCVWDIKVSPGSTINIRFDEFDLSNSPNCEENYLEIYDKDSTVVLLQTCGESAGEQVITSSTNEITVTYFSTASDYKSKFKMSYVTNCMNQILVSPTGSIASPNYPYTYPSDSECLWIIGGVLGSTMELKFDDFQLEDRGIMFGSCSDTLQLFEGANAERFIGEYCGTEKPGLIRTVTNVLFIRFASDSHLQYGGFLLNYEIKRNLTTEGCGDKLEANSQLQYTTSPNYPEFYPSNARCTWEITAPVGYSVLLKFEDFDLETVDQCYYDYVNVYSVGQTELTSLVGAFCDNRTALTTRFQSMSEQMIVRFISDVELEFKGFKASYVMICGSLMTASYGVIRSHSISYETYHNNLDCLYHISVAQSGVVLLHFKTFVLESSPNCTKDYVIIKDGGESDSPVIGRYCGNSIPENITSSSHQVTVEFVTDGENVAAGFELIYEEQVAGCGGEIRLDDTTVSYELSSPGYPKPYSSSIECQWTLHTPIDTSIEFLFQDFDMPNATFCSEGSVQLSLGTNNGAGDFSHGPFCGFNPPELAKHYKSPTNQMVVSFKVNENEAAYKGFKAVWKIGCGGHYRAASGQISSPPTNQFPGMADCMYEIDILTQQQIHITFNRFGLAENDVCNGSSGDFLEIYNGAKELMSRYCGTSKPISTTSPTNKIFIRYHVQNNAEVNGFEVDFDTIGKACGGNLFSRDGFESLFYPNAYPLNRVCSWVLQASDVDAAVQLNFTSFDLAQSDNCTQDYIEVRNGATESGPLIGRYCGIKDEPFLVTSSGYNLHVKFVSDKLPVRGKGFQANFKSLKKQACGGNIEGTLGNITSPKYPENYPDDIECVWKITVAKDRLVELTVNHLDLETDFNCPYDFLEVRESETGSVLNRLCQVDDNGKMIMSLSNTLYLRFVTDNVLNFKGFHLTWKEVSPACGGKYQSPSGTIYSPNYPKLAESLDCEWEIVTPTGTTVTVTVEELELRETSNCTVDQLLISNHRDVSLMPLTRVCGSATSLSTTVYQTSENMAFIYLKTGDAPMEKTLKGFKMSYTSNVKGCGSTITAQDGTIVSPNFINGESDPLDCEWKIEAQPGDKIFLYVEELDLRNSFQCLNFVEFSDHIETTKSNGDVDIQKPVINRLCSSKHDSVYESSQNILYIRYRKDEGFEKGFKFSFNTGCGGILKGRSGYTKSPNYPLQYPPNQECVWRLDLQPHYHVQLTEVDFNLPPSNDRGVCSDFAEFRDGLNVTDQLLIKLCGNQLPSNYKNYEHDSHQLLLRFVSSNTTHSGTEVYRAKSHYKAACGERITDSTYGIIQTPRSQDYNHEEDCVWVIEFPPDKQITLVFKQFNIEFGNDMCPFDYVQVRDGGTEQSPLMGTFCGTRRAPVLRSSGNLMYIKFHSDKYISRDGFVLEYSMEQNLQCGGILHANETAAPITSPGYPSTVQTNIECGWSIRAAAGEKILLTFDEFDLSNPDLFEDFDCQHYLDVYDSVYPDSHLLRKALCKDIIPEPITSLHNGIYIRLHTSSSIRARIDSKFKISYKTIKGACGGKLVANTSSQVLTSENYPLNFTANEEHCDWLVTTKEDEKIVITVTSLDLPLKSEDGECMSSRLILSDGLLAGNTQHVLCGTNTFQFTTNTHLARITLTREASAKGFQLTYRSLDNCNATFNESSGLIASPNYPLRYNTKIRCTYQITAPDDHLITLYPYVFMLEDDFQSDCLFDYLNIYDGMQMTNDLLVNNKSFCGNDGPGTLRSSGNSMSFYFHSDEYFTLDGFAMTYMVSKQECIGQISASEGSVTSPNYPLFYDGSYSCEWNITVSTDRRVQLNVTHFELEEAGNGLDCNSADYLEFFDGGYDNSMGRFCGFHHPAPRKSSSNIIIVRFVSNQENNDYRGFQLVFKEIL